MDGLEFWSNGKEEKHTQVRVTKEWNYVRRREPLAKSEYLRRVDGEEFGF